MANVGFWLLILGLGSFGINYFGYEFKLLMWVDQWGDTTGTMIRLGCAALGLILIVVSAAKSAKTE